MAVPPAAAPPDKGSAAVGSEAAASVAPPPSLSQPLPGVLAGCSLPGDKADGATISRKRDRPLLSAAAAELAVVG